MSGGSGPLEAVVDYGFTEHDVAELLRDLLVEANTVELSGTPAIFKRGFIWGTRGIVVTFEDGSLFELTVRRLSGPKRS